MDLTPMLVGGEWRPAATGQAEDVTSPYDGSVVGAVPVAGQNDVDDVLSAAEAGAALWRRTPAHARMGILLRAAELAEERAPDVARLISAEEGKTITEATGEAARSGQIIRLARSKALSCTATRFRWMPTPGPGRTRSGLRCISRAGLLSPSRRSTTRRY